MATRTSSLFERKPRDARPEPATYTPPMINQEMTGREWGILLILAVIWGGAFMFIGVAVRHVEPLTYVWLRLTIAAGAMWLFLKLSGGGLGLPVSTAADGVIAARPMAKTNAVRSVAARDGECMMPSRRPSQRRPVANGPSLSDPSGSAIGLCVHPATAWAAEKTSG